MMMNLKIVTIIGLCQLLLFMLGTVNSVCQEKYADGLGPNDKRIFTVGDTATLICDVSAEKASDQIYWKFGNNVMSEANTVVGNFKHKFNVTVTKTTESGKVKQIYTLSWIVELDDSGKYNCTCTKNGIQFPVWVKRPCSKRKHVVTNTTESNITSQAIVNYLNTNESIEISEVKPLNVNIRLDCLCTWPGINRTFLGEWKPTGGDSCTASKECGKAELPATLNITQDMSSFKPTGCYQGQGATTFRYQNVFASFLGVTFIWNECLSGREYGFHMDGGDDPVFKVKLACPEKCINGKYKGQDCTDARNITMDVGKAMFVMNIKPNECKKSSIDTGVDRTECCECIMEINCTKEGTIQPRYMNKEVVTVSCNKGAPTTGAPTTNAPSFGDWWKITLTILGCLIVIGIIIGIVVYCYCERKKSKERREHWTDTQVHTNPAFTTSQINLATQQENHPPNVREPVRDTNQPNSGNSKVENGRAADKYVVEEPVVTPPLGQISQAPGGDFQGLSLRNDYDDVLPLIQDPKKMYSELPSDNEVVRP